MSNFEKERNFGFEDILAKYIDQVSKNQRLREENKVLIEQLHQVICESKEKDLEITQLKENLRTIDRDTGLLTTEGFNEKVQEIIEQDPSGNYMLFFLDFNNLSEIDKLHKKHHAGGNEALLEVVSVLKRHSTEEEPLSKVFGGGDEIEGLLKRDKKDVLLWWENLSTDIEMCGIFVSVGVVPLNKADIKGTSILADTAMYSAKEVSNETWESCFVYVDNGERLELS